MISKSRNNLHLYLPIDFWTTCYFRTKMLHSWPALVIMLTLIIYNIMSDYLSVSLWWWTQLLVAESTMRCHAVLLRILLHAPWNLKFGFSKILRTLLQRPVYGEQQFSNVFIMFWRISNIPEVKSAYPDSGSDQWYCCSPFDHGIAHLTWVWNSEDTFEASQIESV